MAFSSIGNPRDEWNRAQNYYWAYANYWNLNPTTATVTTNTPSAVTFTATSTTNITINNIMVQNYGTGSQIRVRTAAEIALAEMAEKASEQLVQDLVGEHGFKAWKQLGYIEIDSATRPGIVYRVKSDAIDLFQKKDGKIIDLRQWLCVHPKPLDKGIYPRGDEVATRILLTRFAEDELWNTANLHDKRSNTILPRQEQLARYARMIAQVAVAA